MEGHGSGGPGLEPRVKELETGFHALHADMSRMGKEQERQGRELARVSSSVEGFGRILADVSEKLDVQRTKRPDWGVFVSMGALLLAIGAATLWPINQRVALVEMQQQYQQQMNAERGKFMGEFNADREHMKTDIERLQDRVDRIHDGD